jgi:hypothetical protein
MSKKNTKVEEAEIVAEVEKSSGSSGKSTGMSDQNLYTIFSIFGLVLNILGLVAFLCVGFFALIFNFAGGAMSGYAYYKMEKEHGKKDYLALSGIILTVVSVLLNICCYGFFIAFFGSALLMGA